MTPDASISAQATRSLAEASAGLPLPKKPASPAPESIHDMNGAQKAAVLLIALGAEAGSAVLQQMHDEEVERISIEIAKFRNLPSELVEAVLLEYRDLTMAHDYMVQGGALYTREVLESALGSRRAEEIMMRVEAAMQVSAFHLLQTVETSQLTNYLQNEHPQTAALILAHLNPRKAADIIEGLGVDYQTEIIYRLATMGKTSPELLRDIEDVIRQQIGSVFGAELSVSGGAEKVADILNNSTRHTERTVIETVRERDPSLAASIKGLMFTFDDLVQISDRDMQRLLVEVEQAQLSLALRGASGDLKNKILHNVSERAAQMIEEEIDLMGPVRLREIEDAQRHIVDLAHGLEEREEILLTRSSEDQMV